MPPLTPEQRESLMRKVADLKHVYLANCAYPYRQGDELKKTSAYRKSQGVCFAMCLDWLRRRMWNVYNPEMKAKRNFNDPKYDATKKARVALTTKHGKLQDAYKQQVEQQRHSTVHTILGKMVEAAVVSSGMDRLSATKIADVYAYELDEQAWEDTKNGMMRMGAANAHYAFKQKLAGALQSARDKLATVPAVGVLIEMQGDDGHAIALFLNATQDAFLDPNLGEYTFTPRSEKDRELNFVANVWYDVYHRFFGMDGIRFSLIEYQGADVI